MIYIKEKKVITTMAQAGMLLAEVFTMLHSVCIEGSSTLDIDTFISNQLQKRALVSMTKGYMGYNHVSCISINDEVVHGVPNKHKKLCAGDLVKVDICASYNGYCADMARPFFVGSISKTDKRLSFVNTARVALNKGIGMAIPGNRLTDISAAIQQEIESAGYNVVRDFAGHGIGRRMHEDPEILNYGKPGCGPLLKEGMVFALEPMLTMGNYDVYIADDGWTAKTVDGSLAMHIEDTVAITHEGPRVLTNYNSDLDFNINGEME
ncbi:MAG TPA: type I methionyl aminopeptidase [Candidatus Babeliales bacterium]|jgi:methionyl aminopeptidase|nr:type I methionyl aminopeptidase [Candidatus Babeliales bacterium]